MGLRVAPTLSLGQWLTHKDDPCTQFMPMPGGLLVFVTVANAPSRGCAAHFVPMDADALWAFLAGVVKLPDPNPPTCVVDCKHEHYTRGAAGHVQCSTCYRTGLIYQGDNERLRGEVIWDAFPP